MRKVLTNMSGTYNAPDEATPITPPGTVLRAVAGFRAVIGYGMFVSIENVYAF